MENAVDPTLGLPGHLGIRLLEASPDRVVATMTITENHLQPLGYLHGGASVALAETVASYGGFTSLKPGQAVFGVEINANHIRPKRAGVLRAVGSPLHRGRTTQVWQIHIFDENEKLVCTSRCTLGITDEN